MHTATMEDPTTSPARGTSRTDDAPALRAAGWTGGSPGALGALLDWVEHTAEPVVALDGAGRIVIANPAFARAFAVTTRTPSLPAPASPSHAASQATDAPAALARFVPLLSPPRLARWIGESASGAARVHRLLAEAVGADGDRFLVAATLLPIDRDAHLGSADHPGCVVSLRPLDAPRGLPLRSCPIEDTSDAVVLGALLDATCRTPAAAQARGRIQRRPHDVAARIAADPDAVREALGRLLDNALRYAADETPVTLRTRRETCEPAGAPQGVAAVGHIVITIADRGRGFTRSQLQRAFEPFSRSGAAASGAGPGLGLAIARHLIEAQRGWIELRSDAGIGTEAEVWLPEAQ